MARDFDGTNDEINFGSDASIDDFATKTIAGWVRTDGASGSDVILAKSNFDDWALSLVVLSGEAMPSWQEPFATSRGIWDVNVGSGFPSSGFAHVAVVYDRGSPSNDPTLYVNGVSVAFTETLTPVGAWEADAALNLMAGEYSGGSGDLDGLIGHLVYHDALLDAAAINRARFWGRPHGGMKVYHPLWSTKLANEGTAVADGTVTGTTVNNAALPRVERMWGSMMGVGR